MLAIENMRGVHNFPMRTLAIVLLLVAMPLVAWAGADCKDLRARYEDIACASEALDSADKDLNEAYKALFASMDEEGKTRLKEAQLAWIQFRNTDTALAYKNSGEGGSLGSLIATNHKLELTLDRARQLKEFSNVGGR
jgi:uncharacterized protein YecT (DUF1311 family)